MSDNGSNFLSSNSSELEYLQDDDQVSGYDYNRIVDALTGNRNGMVTINSDGLGVVVGPNGIAGVNGTGGTTFGISATGTSVVAHNDTWVNTENVDPGGFPARLNFVIPGNSLKVLNAVLSFKLLTYRTFNSFTVSATGGGSAHNHSATPSVTTTNVALTHTLRNDGAGWSLDDGATRLSGTTAFDTINTANESAHTHSISGSSFLGITEGAMASGVTIQFIDGVTGATVDQTAPLGGPWNADTVEMNILPYLPIEKGVWHTVNLASATLGQIQSHLRITVLVQANP